MDFDIPLPEVLQKLAIALGLGLIIGLQRQRTDSRLAGIRTFPLITILGTIVGLLASQWGGWVLAAGFVSLAALITIGNFTWVKANPQAGGTTTEVATLLMFGLGAYLVVGYTAVAVVIAGTTATLLHFKPEMHRLAGRIGEKDFTAIIQFILITLVILPILPNRTYGPYNVLNPYKIWLMVILIVGISLAGYVAYKLMSPKSSAVVGGILGGLISSTATTVSYARRSREAPQSSALAALVIMIASTVAFVRVLVVIAVAAPRQFVGLALPLGTMLGFLILIALALFFRTRREGGQLPIHGNPSELKPAIIFALLYGLVLLGVGAGQAHFGKEGLYLVSILSGLTDMDAITLSTIQMVKEEMIDAFMGWRMILIAALSNFVFKGATVVVLGDEKLRARIAVVFGVALAMGLAILVLWPAK